MQVSEVGIKIVILLAALAVAFGTRFLPSSKEESVLERALEGILEKEIGCETDLSPSN